MTTKKKPGQSKRKAAPPPPPPPERKPFWVQTDYPFVELGDLPNHPAPLREALVIRYDGDKYVEVVVYGQGKQRIRTDIKAGYCYDCTKPARTPLPIQRFAEELPISEVPSRSVHNLRINEHEWEAVSQNRKTFLVYRDLGGDPYAAIRTGDDLLLHAIGSDRRLMVVVTHVQALAFPKLGVPASADFVNSGLVILSIFPQFQQHQFAVAT